MRYLISMIFLTTLLFSADLAWPSDYKEALVKAKKENKLIYVFITSDSCQWCRKFERTTLQDKGVQKRLAKEYVSIHLSRDRHSIPEFIQTSPVPRHYFLDQNGTVLYNTIGHRNVELFDSFMNNAQEKLEKNKN
ncbi:MAG: thioredoxin family protein [Campylobacterota bacterium]|nr:thioredoxin family protein [Campylobacterota bacterium]